MAKHFMWSYENQFQVLAEGAAVRLLQFLDPRFQPWVFLVGFLTRKREGRLPVCVVPEGRPYRPEVFNGLRETMVALRGESRERDALPLAPVEEVTADQAAGLRVLRQAAHRKIREGTRDLDVLSFCSWPTQVDDYLVLLVLQLSRSVYESHYRLPNYPGQDRTPGVVPTHRSLLDTAIAKYLEVAARDLRKPDPGRDGCFGEENGKLFRAAARGFLDSLVGPGGSCPGSPCLYDACNAISALTYEGREGVGRLILAHPRHPDVRVEMELTSPVRLSDFTAVRKLLQLASGDLCLLGDGVQVYGLCTVRDSYDPAVGDILLVTFSGNSVWDLSHAGNVLLGSRFGAPRPRPPRFPTDQLGRYLPRLFPGITAAQVDNLCTFAQAVTDQPHGAMLVISAAAAAEAQRLSRQSTRVRPFQLSRALIPSLTSIDGAVLVDVKGTCHAIGVILDGFASDRGTSSRGARYNSAVRYAQGRNDCLIIVKSEDGMVNLIPSVLPSARPPQRDAGLPKLLPTIPGDVFPPWEHYPALNRPGKNGAYLSPSV